VAPADPITFVRATPPFDVLPPPLFAEVAGSLEVAFYPRGTRLVERGGATAEHLFVIRKGAVRLERDGQTLDVLEEGELFGFTSLIAGVATSDVIVDDDLLAYRLPRAVFTKLLDDAAFSRHFATSLAERLRTLEEARGPSFQAELARPVGDLVERPPVSAGAEVTVAEAARKMRTERVDSIIVLGEPPGIVTDRDLRNRVLAEGKPAETPLGAIQSSPLMTIAATAPVYEAWRTLLDLGLHHLPVVRGAEIVGIVTASDVLRRTSQGPIPVLRRVERLKDPASLPGYAAQIAEMVRGLLGGGLDVLVVAGLVASLNATLVRRILRWAEADLGPPPCAYAWLVYGSEGRCEQLLLTDQDNALVFADDTPAARAYFASFAARVVGDLVTAGFPACPGGYMATRWQGPLAEWEARFAAWIDAPTPDALLAAHIFFDYRIVHGRLALAPLDASVARAGKSRVFLSALAKSAMEFRPLASLLLRLKGGSTKIDFKAQGISPLVFLARCYGIEAGARAPNSLERLAAAVDAGIVSKDAYATLAEAYRFLLRLRVRHQLAMLAAGEPPSNQVALRDLSSVERSHLKESFDAISSWQETARFHYRTDLL
jgi:CBS domain-containing protein